MSSFGRLFRVSTFGESHCAGVGCIVEGVPPRMQLTEADIQPQLSRRRPGQSRLTTPRDEKDTVKIIAGVEKGITLGTPLALMVPNEDQRPKDYKEMDDVPRPSHADYTYQCKYGVRASSGGGRSSARETIGRVAAGAVAEKFLLENYGVEIVAWVSAVGKVQSSRKFESLKTLTRDDVDASVIRCPDKDVEQLMIQQVEAVQKEKDSIGGVVTCVMRNVPVGLGEPCFDKLEAMLAHAMLSIPATKGFEIGSGFEGATMTGSTHNDMFVPNSDESKSNAGRSTSPIRKLKLRTVSNNSGGIQGGISNGEDIVIRVAFKPPATIGRDQKTCNFEGDDHVLAAKGRHDPCVVPRAVPIVEAMCALVIADAALIQESRVASCNVYPEVGKVGAQS